MNGVGRQLALPRAALDRLTLATRYAGVSVWEWDLIIDTLYAAEGSEFRERLGSVALLDVRAGERYRGEVEPVDPIPGHIPTARNAPAGANTSPDGRLRSPEELRERFATLTGDLPVVVSCGVIT